jgi:hypothetical protein
MPRRSLLPPIAAACAGIAAWCSIGALAVVNGTGGFARLGLLPPVWLLPLVVVACVGTAWAVRLSPRTSLPLLFSVVLLLPWLPWRVPAAFLMWSGRSAWGVWLGVAIAMLAARGTFRPSAHWFGDARRAPRIAAVVACVLYIASAWSLADILPGGDEPHYLVMTQSLLRDGDLQIENNHARGDYLEYFRGQLRPDYLRRGTNGQIYSIHAPGLPAVIAPAYALQGYHGVVVFLSIVAGIGSALLWLASYGLTGSVGAAWFAWAAWALTVPFFFETFSVFPDGLGATLVLFAALPLLDGSACGPREARSRRVRASGGGTPRALNEVGQGPGRGRWVATGAVLALLPWLHTRFAIIAASLGVFLVLRLIGSAEGRAHLVAFLAIPVASALAWFGFFRAIYGTFSPAAPYGGYTQTSPANILTGLPALLFDQQFGILPNAPVYGFCFVGMLVLARRRPRLATELSVTSLAYLLSSSAYYMWWAGSSAPARFAVPVLPLLVLPGAWLWKSARDSATRAVGMAALVVSLAITAALVVVDGGHLAYNFRDGYSLAAEWLSPIVDLPQGLPSFFRQTSGAALFRALCWIVPILGAWLALRTIERKRPAEASRATLAFATPVWLAVATMLSLDVVWRMDRVAGPSRESSEIGLLEKFDPRTRPNGIDFAALQLAPAERIVSRLSIVTPTRRPAPPPRTLLLVPNIVPAGQYALEVPSPAGAAGTASLVIGRMARPIATWNLRTDLRDGAVTFELPVNVGSIVVEGDDEAVRTTKFLALRPLRVVPPQERLTSDYAHRVERYGPGFAYFFDDGAFVEQPGFWIRGGGGTRMAAMPAQHDVPLQLFVRNAPVANRLTIEIDGQTHVLALGPREERMVPVPLTGDQSAAMIRFQTDTGFRPSLVEPGSTDTRFLGCWIELR